MKSPFVFSSFFYIYDVSISLFCKDNKTKRYNEKRCVTRLSGFHATLLPTEVSALRDDPKCNNCEGDYLMVERFSNDFQKQFVLF